MGVPGPCACRQSRHAARTTRRIPENWPLARGLAAYTPPLRTAEEWSRSPSCILENDRKVFYSGKDRAPALRVPVLFCASALERLRAKVVVPVVFDLALVRAPARPARAGGRPGGRPRAGRHPAPARRPPARRRRTAAFRCGRAGPATARSSPRAPPASGPRSPRRRTGTRRAAACGRRGC